MLCKACDKYLELLSGKDDLRLGQIDQDNDQVAGKFVVMLRREMYDCFLTDRKQCEGNHQT